ncbi:PREDICTED: suppressor of tumorigenicity 14 protein homolog [Habropoda laboriosa]|uniref:suppressor of tumorigenicity 14 protein homolog n=1 Tax=Habropoda laboriosa TaxID=597456 RepID=UPI00083E48BA|nr:PREDICTED: suppressor of tumorigenicity 14 protein homolog [Habropoda laboriosa]
MNARVALSVACPLLIVLSASLVDQADARVKRSPDPPWAKNDDRGPPGHGGNRYGGQPNFNDKRGPPGGRPPGLSGGGPPGLSGGGPPGLFGGGPPDGPPGGHPGGPPGSPPGFNKPGKGPGRPPNLDYDDDYRPGRPGGPGGPGERPFDGDRPDDRDEIDRTQPPEEIKCRKNEFRCRSNECLPKAARCDNRPDCRDSSDELDCPTTPENESGCVLPEQPEGGSYELGGCGKPCSMRPGDKVPSNSILTYTCRNNYVLKGSSVPVCVNDKWHNMPSCLKTCSPLSSSTVNILCAYQGNEVSCTDRIKPGTVATLSCKSSYKLPVTNDPGYRAVTCLEEGLWDRPLFRCLPECGIAISQGNALVVHGFEAKLGVFPWHVGIYNEKAKNNYEQICGGTLISSNLVVSAAHCFYDEVYGKLKDKSKYAVAAGKHYRSWDANENYVQKSMLAEISLPERYIGMKGNFAQDIALLKLKTPFELTTVVRPICIDWDNVYETRQLELGQNGKSVGWGKTIEDVPSETLQEVNMPFVPYGQCLSAVPEEFRGFITSDKFCAGRLNGSSVCDGDSGGGLCFEMEGIWYLRGIVSVSPVKANRCDYRSYTVFTSTGYFRDWIRAAYVNT